MNQFSHDDYKILEKVRDFQGYFAVDTYQIQHRLFAGGWSEPFQRELFERGHAVAVLLYDPFRQEVLLLEQFRIGALTSETGPWMIEIVAGIIDKGEEAEQVAKRECFEEAGQTVTDLHYIGKYFCTPGGSSESIIMYCALIDSSDVGGIFGLDHEQEDIRVFTMTLDEVRDGLQSGLFENATTLIAMQWLLLNQEKLTDSKIA